MKMLLQDFSARVGREDFSNQQLRMRINMRLVRIVGLE